MASLEEDELLKQVLAGAALAALLLGCSSAANAPALSLGEAPWKDGERAVYDIVDKNSAKVGSEEIDYARSGDGWLITVADKAANVDQAAKVRVDQALKPLGEDKTVKAQGTDATVSTTYQGGKLDIKAVVNGQNRSASLDVPANSLDNDQLLATLRSLAFAEGYQGKYVNVVGMNATKIDTTIRVVGKEKVDVPAGSFDAWKVELDFGQAKQYVWYQVDPPHQMVQYDNGATKTVLTP